MVFIHGATGSIGLTLPIAALAITGIAAETLAARGRLTLGPSAVAVPWLLAPPVLLLTVSQIHCVWNGRYEALRADHQGLGRHLFKSGLPQDQRDYARRCRRGPHAFRHAGHPLVVRR